MSDLLRLARTALAGKGKEREESKESPLPASKRVPFLPFLSFLPHRHHPDRAGRG